MSQIQKYPIPDNITEHCLITPAQYEEMYQLSIRDPDAFWGKQGKILARITPYSKVKNTSFALGNVSIIIVRKRRAESGSKLPRSTPALTRQSRRYYLGG